MCTKFIAYGIQTMGPILANLFNEAVCYEFPKSQTLNTITPIHKARDPMDLKNYKTIMIGHVMSKIYASVLDGEVSARAEIH